MSLFNWVTGSFIDCQLFLWESSLPTFTEFLLDLNFWNIYTLIKADEKREDNEEIFDLDVGEKPKRMSNRDWKPNPHPGGIQTGVLEVEGRQDTTTPTWPL